MSNAELKPKLENTVEPENQPYDIEQILATPRKAGSTALT